MNLPETYWAWVAGILDGEGSYRVVRALARPGRNAWWGPEVMVINTDARIVDQLLLSGGTRSGPRSTPGHPTWSPKWKWTARGPWLRGCGPLVLPYAVSKQPQLQAVLDAGAKGSEELAYTLSVMNIGKDRADARVAARLATP